MLYKVVAVGVVVLTLTGWGRGSWAGAQTAYPATVAILQAAYQNEMRAYMSYMAYARKASADSLPNLSYLFVAFATAESIHARNFQKTLSMLGVEAEQGPNGTPAISGTKDNLKRALAFEMLDIDQRYPQLIARARQSENHEDAIRYLSYSWEAEKQHRDLIKKMQSGTGVFFGVLSKRVEATHVQYSICAVCGSTVIERPRPDQICPICKSPASEFKDIQRLK